MAGLTPKFMEEFAMNMVRPIQSVIAISVATGLAKFGNENHETLKEDGSVLLPALCLLGAIVLLVYGIKSFCGAFAKQ